MRKTPLKVVSLEAILGCKDCRFVWSRRHAKCFVHVPRAIVVPSYRVTVPFISRVVGVKTCLLSTNLGHTGQAQRIQNSSTSILDFLYMVIV